MFVPLKLAQTLLDMPGGVSQIDLTVTDLFGAESVEGRAGRLFGPDEKCCQQDFVFPCHMWYSCLLFFFGPRRSGLKLWQKVL